jgi:preprotein translocase subunit SecA
MIGNNNKEKDVEYLFDEIIANNPNSASFIYKIIEIYTEIINIQYLPEKNNEKSIKNQINEIKKKIVEKKLDKDSFYKKIIPIIILSNKYIFKYEPRKIQIIALLLFLYKDKSKGLIEQIPTGEGKTSISSFLAVIKALEGKKVDIITSSLVLAERDAKLLRNFYDLFGLSVDFCRDIDPNSKTDNKYLENKCYIADILYGDTLSFEGDILRTNFMEIEGRGKRRPYDCLIIDEIDNICIDNIKNVTELLDDFHGYKFLEYIYYFIFFKLKELDKELRKNMDEKNFKNSIILNKEEIVEKLEAEFKEEIIDFKKLKEREKDKIILPEHLNNFVKTRMRKWCESAFDAMYIYEKDKQYIISKYDKYGFDTIKPVDYFNTGVIEENSVWTGLHQFLEIKEGLRLTEENLNSCYMSNLTFFKKYITEEENNIYGLTGTLGGKRSQEALKILYNLELLFIPSFKESKLKTYKEIIINNKKEYENTLFETLKFLTINKKRSVLVIFKYINEVNEVYNYLIKKGISKDILIKYSRNDITNQTNFLNEEIKPGVIILSTNLSGRGTDIKISKELEKNKGLHVILTFMPKSERIERQAFGRAGRKGEQGSGQYIIMSSEKFSQLIKERNQSEENEYKYLINSYQKKIDLFQEIFEDFSDLLNSIKKNKTNKYILLDIKERWGLFLVENDLNNIEKEYKDENSLKLDETFLEKTRKNYKKFKESIIENVKNKYEFFNPLILSKTLSPENCDKAIERSPFLTLGAYLYRIYLKSQNIKNEEEYLTFAFDNFRNLEKICNILTNQFKIYAELMEKIGIKKESDLFKQNNEKINFLNFEILTLIKKNISVLDLIKNNKGKYNIVVKRLFLKNINKDINGNNKYSQDIIDYFKDFGGVCLFELETKNKCWFLNLILR